MELHEDLLKLRLAEIEFLSEDQVALLEMYNIHTIGQLLGSTRGFSNTRFFQDLDPEGDLLANLKDLVSDEIIESFRFLAKDYPTGLIINPGNDEKQ